MPNVAATVRLTAAELSIGVIKPVTVLGPDGTARIIQVRIPPGTVSGALLRVPAQTGSSGEDLYVRVRPQFGPADSTGYHSSAYPRRRPHRKRLLAGVLTAAVLGVVIGLVVANQGGGGAHNTAAPIPTSEQPTTTTVPPESAATYQQALNALATALNSGLAELNNAQTPQAISTAVTDLSNGLQQAAPAFNARAPIGTETANSALATALQSLTGADLGSVSSAASNTQVCLGPAATTLLSRTASLAQLRTAIADLTSGAADSSYQFGAALPAVTQDGTRSAATGTIVAGGVHNGVGQLTITNGGSTDATVGLVRDQSSTPLITVYVGQGASYTLDNVPDGIYHIYVTSGDDWDSGARLFSRNCVFQQFDQTMDFTTTYSEYTTYTITLTPVLDGNATESSVDPGAFPH